MFHRLLTLNKNANYALLYILLSFLFGIIGYILSLFFETISIVFFIMIFLIVGIYHPKWFAVGILMVLLPCIIIDLIRMGNPNPLGPDMNQAPLGWIVGIFLGFLLGGIGAVIGIVIRMANNLIKK